MIMKYDHKTNIVGIGATEEEAEAELKFNLLRHDISYDKDGYYMKRRSELYSWLPLNNVFSIKSLCSICVRDGRMFNTTTGVSMSIEPKYLSHYLYMFFLLDGLVSFDDFTITMAAEVNQFLGNISSVFGTLDDFPYTKPGHLDTTTAIHTLPCGAYVYETTTSEIVVSDKNKSYAIDVPNGVDVNCMVAYGLAKLGVIYNGYNSRRVI